LKRFVDLELACCLADCIRKEAADDISIGTLASARDLAEDVKKEVAKTPQVVHSPRDQSALHGHS
jgi:hypothetical protein